MDRMTHSGLEYMSVVFCIGIACYAWKSYQRSQSGFSLLWMLAFVVEAASDFVHASYALYPTTMAWIPWTWGAGREFLWGVLVLAVIYSTTKMTDRKAWVIAVGALAASAVLMIPSIGSQMSFVQQHDAIILRPFDFMLMLQWALLIPLFHYVKTAKAQVPSAFYIFILLGIASHYLMAFHSAELFDAGFVFAHIFKVAEYAVWFYAARQDEQQMQDRGSYSVMQAKAGTDENIEKLRRLVQEMKL